MLTLGPIAFTAPWLLATLAGLPVLWLILRVVPPAPIRRRFPGVILLLGLGDDETQSDRTPWWLLVLRMVALAAVILAFAGPVLNPEREAAPGRGPLLILMDGGWPDARDWSERIDRVDAALSEAARNGRPVAVAVRTDLPAGGPVFQAADTWRQRLASFSPAPWLPDAGSLPDWLTQSAESGFDTFWLSGGIDDPGRDAVLAALRARGAVQVFESGAPVYALRPARFDDGAIGLTALRARPGPETAASIAAIGLDPSGVERPLASVELVFKGGTAMAETALSLPSELRNRVTRFEMIGQRTAGAVSLTDDALRRREVALIAGRGEREGLQLLSPLHYLEQALAPHADLIGGAVPEILQANPDVIILADVARFPETDAEALLKWVEAGGLLLRFAGPRLAAADVAVDEIDPLMPVRLRAGGRTVGGAMSWGEPKALSAFPDGSPFQGLEVPDEVTVTAQVLAQPDPELPQKVIAMLADGTPLVTRAYRGGGQVVLFHVTANADWSSLPLSGLFVRMLERLSVAARSGPMTAEALDGTTWQAAEILDGFGRLAPAEMMQGIDGPRLVEAVVGPHLPPGLYQSESRRLAVNVIGAETTLTPTSWPSDVPVAGLDVAAEKQLAGPLLVLAALLLLADVAAALILSGRLGLRRGIRLTAMAAAVALGLGVPPGGGAAQAQEPLKVDEEFARSATTEVVLGHVRTGNAQVDEVARAGLEGLSQMLYARTSVEPADPVMLDLETDELSFFPLLYWPITPDQPLPSSEAYGRLNRFLRSGGMILFDTRDADLAAAGSDTENARKLRQLARPLDVPPLEPIPDDHVLTRAFYLLQDFPGRYQRGTLWVEAAPPNAELAEGMPFRNLNDGVTPIVIGSNDYAGAWAVTRTGGRMLPVGRGYAGERQREIAFRFGVNLVMHVLTGNYKSDQVHVPALLDRLGQ